MMRPGGGPNGLPWGGAVMGIPPSLPIIRPYPDLVVREASWLSMKVGAVDE